MRPWKKAKVPPPPPPPPFSWTFKSTEKPVEINFWQKVHHKIVFYFLSILKCNVAIRQNFFETPAYLNLWNRPDHPPVLGAALLFFTPSSLSSSELSTMTGFAFALVLAKAVAMEGCLVSTQSNRNTPRNKHVFIANHMPLPLRVSVRTSSGFNLPQEFMRITISNWQLQA